MSADLTLRPRRKKRRRWPHFVAAAVVLVLATAGGVTAAVLITGQSEPVAPRMQASFDVANLPIPRNALMLGTPNGWAIAPGSVVAAVGPEVGSAVDGEIALRVEAPAIAEPVAAASADILVTPGSSYSFSASVRNLAAPSDVPAWFSIAGVQVELPPLSAKWTTVEAEIVVPAESTGARIALELGGPIDTLSIDRLSLVEVGATENLIPNPSFEDLTTAGWLLNESLIVDTDTAALAVAVPPGDVSWTATDANGAVVAEGQHTVSHPIEMLPLDAVPQGFVTVSLAHPDGIARMATVAVVDGVNETPADPRFGVTTHVAQPYSGQAPRLAASLGYGIVRDEVVWWRIEVTSDVYDFPAYYDAPYAALRANGAEFLAIIGYGNVNHGGIPSTPESSAAFGRFASEVAARYSPTALEVWNEFNHLPFNRGKCGLGAECYMPILAAVDQQLSERGLDDVAVVAGATALYEGQWFDDLWDQGGLAASDAMSYHPYEVYDDPRLLVDTIEHARASTASRGKELPIWITELGWTTKTGGVSDRVQAERLVQAETLALAHGVDRFFWYDLINDFADPAEHEGNFGLFRQVTEGVAANQPKLAALTQAMLISHIAGREFSRFDDLGDAAISAVFGAPGDEVRVAWSTGDPISVSIPSDSAVTVTAVDGTGSLSEPVGGVVEVELTGAPVFVAPALAP